MTEEENGKKRRRFALLLQKQAQRSAELSNRLEGQIAVFVDHSSEAVTAATNNDIGCKHRLFEGILVAGSAIGGSEGRATPGAVTATDGFNVLISKNRELGHGDGLVGGIGGSPSEV
jgi:hypothetical protein